MARVESSATSASGAQTDGRPVAIIAPIDADGPDDPSDDVSDHVLANAPEYVTSMRQADEDLAAGRTSSMADVVADLGD